MFALQESITTFWRMGVVEGTAYNPPHPCSCLQQSKALVACVCTFALMAARVCTPFAAPQITSSSPPSSFVIHLHTKLPLT